ncbi:MAG: amidohydrolase [Proteobacteria bacterium]|nr:amidohydrolase [Pseudomonadota bacterium]
MARACAGAALVASALAAAAAPPADTVYRNGVIYTVDAHDSIAHAVAVRGGKIVYVGDDDGARALTGKATHVVDLGGRMLMPGLVDGHMHPLEGGQRLVACNLEYRSFTVPEFQARLQACLDAHRKDEPDAWLEASNWFRYDMRPAGVAVTRATLDALHTQRPIIVHDSFGHSSLVNSRALALAKFGAGTPDPVGGRIERDAHGEPTGMLEDSAQEAISALLPKPTPADNLAAARAALDALRRQGVTTFLDAVAPASDIEAFTALARSGALTVRAHFAPPIAPGDTPDAAAARREVARVVQIARTYDQGPLRARPSITVRNVKLFMDGVITAPANTGALIEPYLENHGTPDAPRFEPSAKGGPAVYFPAAILREILIGLASQGIDPHLHTDGDLAVRATLDGIQAMRAALPGREIRTGLAHCELVDPADYPRFKELDAVPVLSFQWGKPAADTIEGARDTLGARRHDLIEPAGFLAEKGARVAFGSDWPVDPLDEWFALKVAVTRTAAPGATPAHAGRLGKDPGLSRAAALRAITMNASYELRQDDVTGSIETGKFADFIVLDRNVLEVPADDIAQTKVLRTVVGGRVVYDSGELHRGKAH